MVLASRFQLAQRYRGFGHFLSAASSSRLKTMVGGTLVKASAFLFGLGVSGATIVSGLWIVHSPITVVDVLFVDLIFIFRYF
jgi:hypothetical protein